MLGSSRKEVMIFSIILGLVVAGVLGIVWLPKREIEVLMGPFLPQQQFEMLDKARGTWAQVIGGIFLALGVIATWYRALAADKSAQAALDTAKAAERSASAALESVRAAQEGQITERFTRAVEQLGSEKLEVRLGGIYALERIARDSERDHWTIMEVLATYVRMMAKWDAEKEAEWTATSEEDRPKARPRADIQAVLTVIGRRSRTYGKGESQHLDLSNTDLRGVVLRLPHLEGAVLAHAHLEESDLRGARLQRADLTGAHLQGANLMGADLSCATLTWTHLEGVDLTSCWPLDNRPLVLGSEGAFFDPIAYMRTQLALAIVDENTKIPERWKMGPGEENRARST